MTRRAAQQGFTLLELLLALAISAALLAPLASIFQSAADSGAGTRAGFDMNADARFALDRIATSVAALQPAATDVALDDANNLLAPSKLAYAQSGANLVETDSSVTPARSSVIATNVTAFRLSSPATGDGQPLMTIELTMASGGSTVSAARTVRIGNPL